MIEDALLDRFCQALLSLGSEEQARRFLQDLLSADELAKTAIRLEIMRLLLHGLTRQQVREELLSVGRPPSLATISRANAVIKHGSGAIETVLEQMREG